MGNTKMERRGRQMGAASPGSTADDSGASGQEKGELTNPKTSRRTKTRQWGVQGQRKTCVHLCLCLRLAEEEVYSERSTQAWGQGGWACVPQGRQGKGPSHAELVYFSLLRETGEKKQGTNSSSGLVHTGRSNHTNGSTNERK